jgi:hypothetical protein
VDEKCYILTSDGELYHYGVPGMKWGVRMDARILANNRRNRRIREAKVAYKAGKMTKEARDAEIQSAKHDKKKMLNETKERFVKAKTDIERQRLASDIRNKTTKEVPNVTLKRGVHVVNALFGGVNAVSTGVSAAAMVMINPAFAGAAIASAAVGIAAEAGKRYAIQLGLDKVS